MNLVTPQDPRYQELLAQCHTSGQLSARQANGHHAAGQLHGSTPTAASAHLVSASRFTDGGQTVHLEPTPRPAPSSTPATAPDNTAEAREARNEAIADAVFIALGGVLLFFLIGSIAGFIWQRLSA